jgi:hypothetical protein
LAIDSAGSMTASQAKLKPVTGYPPRTFDGGMRLQFWPQANLAQMAISSQAWSCGRCPVSNIFAGAATTPGGGRPTNKMMTHY